MFITFVIIINIVTNAKLFTPQKILNRDASYYTNRLYLNWTASKISDEYLPKDLIKPQKISEIESFKKRYQKLNYNQTTLELASNAVSLIGVAALLLVIIAYGKKAS